METTKKQAVIEAIKKDRKRFASDTQHAVSLGISSSQYSRIVNGETDKVISPEKWSLIEKKLIKNWVVVETPMYIGVTAMLEKCHSSAISAIIIDEPDTGKSCAAKHYCQTTPHAAYVDCSQAKDKRSLLFAIAKALGVKSTGRYADVYGVVTNYMINSGSMVVMDDAGYLKHDAFLEIIALWNATELQCAWVLIGDDALQALIDRRIQNQKPGYKAMLSRMGNRYSKVSPADPAEFDKFKATCGAMIIKANAPGIDAQKMLFSTSKSLRNIHKEIAKLNHAA